MACKHEWIFEQIGIQIVIWGVPACPKSGVGSGVDGTYSRTHLILFLSNVAGFSVTPQLGILQALPSQEAAGSSCTSDHTECFCLALESFPHLALQFAKEKW